MSVFLSYRRSDSAYALWIYPSLIQWFGPDRVFWDRKHIAPGADFAKTIYEQIRSSAAFIALVSHNWLLREDEHGRRSIDSPEDWIHRETALALREKRVVIPVLVGGMRAPKEQDLPPALQPLSKLQALSASDMVFHDLLRETLEKVLPGAHETNEGDDEVARLQKRAGTLLRRQAQRLQVRAVELVQEGKLDQATEELDEGFELLMALLDLLPGDTTLDAQLGYLYATMAQAYQGSGDGGESGRYLDLALSVFERIKANPTLLQERPTDVASAIKGIGEVYYGRDEPAAAIEYYRKALEIAPTYVYAWHDLFLAQLAMARRGDLDLPGLRESFEKTKLYGNVPSIGRAQLRELDLALGRYDAAHASETLARARAEKDDAAVAHTCQNLGELARDGGDYEEAERWTREALELFEALGDRQRLARQHWIMASIEVARGDGPAAAASYAKARALYQELGDEATVKKLARAEVANAVADAQRRQNDRTANLRERIRAYDEALVTSTREEHPEEWAATMYQRGVAFQHMPGTTQAQLEEAIRCFDQTLEVLTRNSSAIDWATVMASRGEAFRCLKQEGSRREALRCFDQALEVFSRDEHPNDWASAMMGRALALHFPEDGSEARPEEALRSYDAALTVISSDSDPSAWERMMFHRASVLAALEGPDRTANLKKALESYEALVAIDPDSWGGIPKAAIAALQKQLSSELSPRGEEAT